MSRRMAFPLLVPMALAVSVSGSRLTNPPFGEEGARCLRHAVITGVAAIGLTTNEAASRSALICDGA